MGKSVVPPWEKSVVFCELLKKVGRKRGRDIPTRPTNLIMAKSLIDSEIVNGKKHGNWGTYYANGFKRSEGRYIDGEKEGLWIQYHKNGNKASEATFHDGKHEGTYTVYHENGNLGMSGSCPKHAGKSYDGKKEGAWYWYEEDGETVWRIITYKQGGSRAKPDEYPLGVCDLGAYYPRLVMMMSVAAVPSSRTPQAGGVRCSSRPTAAKYFNCEWILPWVGMTIGSLMLIM